MSRPGFFRRVIRERAVRMAAEIRPEYKSEYAAMSAMDKKLDAALQRRGRIGVQGRGRLG